MENSFTKLDADAIHIYCVLALNTHPISGSELLPIVGIRKKITDKRLREVVNDGICKHIIKAIRFDSYMIEGYWLVWLYPFLTDYKVEQSHVESRARKPYYFSNDNKYLIDYLNALWHNTKQLKSCEEKLLRSPYQLSSMMAIFKQPRYEEAYGRISPKVIEYLYHEQTEETLHQLGALNEIYQLDAKLVNNPSSMLAVEQAHIAFKTGDFDKVQRLLHGTDTPLTYFAEATRRFFEGDYPKALDFFEKGLKKQRLAYKQSFVPIIPEAALYYLMALFSDESESFLPTVERIIDSKTKRHASTDEIFVKLCHYTKSNNTETYSAHFKSFASYDSMEVILWKVIALGFTGENPYETDNWMQKALQALKTAFANGYHPSAYEAAYTLQQYHSEAANIYRKLSKKMKYEPVLSKIKRVEAWEKQINAYLSLEAVKTLIRQENEAGNSRVAYRFYPERKNAQPILQTRKSGGEWNAGRNIAISNFSNKQVDGMTEQDKRIAESLTYHSYAIYSDSFVQMTGHPYIFLEDGEIPVEFVAAKPMLSVVELPQGDYKLESDINIASYNEVHIEKETNTRYKIYHINKQQREIIEAVKRGKQIPEAGKEKLLKVLEHFSAFMLVQTDLAVSGAYLQAKQVESDSRIRVQLLPLGEGLKAELFVKPFGTQPPYCKPGKGGKMLIANQNGVRLQLTRDMETEVHHADFILADIQTIEGFDINEGVISFENPFDALELLEALQRHTDISVVEWPEGERMKLRYSANFSNLKLKMKSGIDWFELEGELKFDEEMVLSIGQLLELVRNSHGRFIELAEGEFIALSEQLRRRLTELSAFTNITKKTATINRFASASIADTFDEFENLKVDKTWRDFRKRLIEAQKIESDIPANLQAELRPYQEEGYRWMTRLSAWGAGACLADDMGLGKTVQTLASLLQRASIGPALVVSPVSVQPNWKSEVERFAPSLTVKTLNNGIRAEILASLAPGDLLITSYGLLQSEEEAITEVEWATVVLDEAHAIKNYTTKTSKAAMTLKAGFRIILTGTPIQNHLGEMWNLFQFINPGLLGSLSHFTDHFIKSDDNNARKRLKKLITPFILRRTKTSVLDELPPKTEIIRKIELSDEEMAFYEAMRRRAIETIQKDDGPQGAKHLKALAEITRLRQACCHPKIVEPKIDIGSTKLSTFLEIAGELKENGHRALVFSQFVTHLTIVREALDNKGFSYQYLDGSTPLAKREIAVNNFQSGKSDLFLISLKAGGLGLNLTAADYVIHLDPWWNPAIEDQASDRAHRIGQNRPVTVYRLVAQHTIEEKIIQLHHTKRDLADSLLEGSDQSAKLSLEEIMSLMAGGE